MGASSREKWIKRAEVYEGLILKGKEQAAKEYLERFPSEKLWKFIKGAQQLEVEKELDAQLEATMGAPSSEEGEGDEPKD